MKLSEKEKPAMKELLRTSIRIILSSPTNMPSMPINTTVLKEGDEIIAGVCAIPTSYKVYDVPGVWGWIMMKVLPKVPYYRRLFRPGEFRYLVFDAIYYKKGREEALAPLFESACAAEGFHTGLTWLDDRSELYR